MKMEVTLSRKGEITIEGVSLSYYGARFEGISVPNTFAHYLLNKETRKAAIKLFHQMKATIKNEAGMEWFLSKAGEDGFDVARQELENIKINRPNGKPKLYRSLAYPHPYSGRSEAQVVLTNGKRAFSFTTNMDVKALPPNVYCKEERTYYHLDVHKIDMVKTCLDEFFTFTKKLMDLRQTTFVFGTHTVLEAFFTDRKRSYRLLKVMDRYGRFRRSAVKCPQGYLLYKGRGRGWIYGRLVSFTGEVFTFARRSELAMLDTVEKALKGRPIERLRREYPTKKEMNKIAARVGTLDPALALVLVN